MPKQIIIAEQHRIAAVFSEDQIQELVVAKGTHQVSDICLGIVENVLPGIDAAFVNIGDQERNGFIHVSDLGPLRLKRNSSAITELLTPQQKVLVQVMKEPTGTKGPRLTGNITLPGRYLVLMPYGKGVNLSRRIRSETERNRLRALAILIKPAGMGLLVRTEAEGMEEEAVMEDLETLQKQWEDIQQEAVSTRPPALLNRDADFIQRVLRDIYSADVNRIVVDSNEGSRRVKHHLMNWSGGKTPLVSIDHHQEGTSVLEYFRINAAIREALRPRVDLPSGGYIIIQPTEALTVIDVNSGSFTRSATARETVLWTNCEAATEIARQLRLRNIAGVIIVDFIDMDSRRDQLQVLEHFNKVLRADKARPQIAQLSELGLVELTRKRQGQNIYELFGSTCPTCNGLGHLVHLPGERAIATETARGPAGIAVEISESGKLPSSAIAQRFLPAPDSTGKIGKEIIPAESMGRSSEGSVSEWDFEPTSNFSEIPLLNHPNYQESSRRRRHRRVVENVGSIREGESLGFTTQTRMESDFSQTVEGFGISVRQDGTREALPTFSSSRSGRETIRPTTEAPEVVTLAMTNEEQEVYAFMGVSPFVLLEEGAVKNPKTALLSLIEPGDEDGIADDMHVRVTAVDSDEELNDFEEQEWSDSSTVFSGEAGTETYEIGFNDYVSDNEIESEDVSDEPMLVRRRRRRSSANLEE